MSRNLGYRPTITRRATTPFPVQISGDAFVKAVAAQKENQAAKDKVASKPEKYSFADMVALSKQDSIDARDLDISLSSIYSYSEEIMAKADAAKELIAATLEPVIIDKPFAEDTKQDALLIFGKEITELTPTMIECLNRITYASSDLVETMERGDQNAGTAQKEKLASMSTVDDVLEKIRVSAPKFGFELLILLILIILEEILKLILSPLCPIVILGIKVGQMISEAIAEGVYTLTATWVDVRDVCQCKDDPTPECKQKYEEGLHSSIARRWDSIQPDFFRGPNPGFPDVKGTLPICDDPDTTRVPNLFETAAAISIIKNFQLMATRQNAKYISDEKAAGRDPGRRDPANGDPYAKATTKYDNILAYMNTDAAKQMANTVKLSAGNLQDTIRIKPPVGTGTAALTAVGRLSVKLDSPGAAVNNLLKNKFGKSITSTLNQMLQNLKALDNMIKSLTSLAFLDSRMADAICCLVRLLFNWICYSTQAKTITDKLEAEIAAIQANPTAPHRPIDEVIEEYNKIKAGTDLAAYLANPEYAPVRSPLDEIFQEVTKQTLKTDFNMLMKKSVTALQQDPRFSQQVKDALKMLKIVEAVISAISSSISADLNFGFNADFKKLGDAMLGIIAKTMTVAVDSMMSEVRAPVQEWMTKAATDPRFTIAIKDCEAFGLLMAFINCGIDAFEITIDRVIQGLQRDTDTKWLQINASITASYNQKTTKIILDIINLLMNDIYLLFTICNIDAIYDPTVLKESSLQISNSLGIPNQLAAQINNTAARTRVYSDFGGGPTDMQVGVLGTEAADTVFTKAAMATSIDPLADIIAPLMQQDFSVMRGPQTSDDSLGRKYNTDETVDPVAAVMDQLADADIKKCATSSFLAVPIVSQFTR